MRVYIVHTRPLPGCCKTGDVPTIMEVEGEIVTPAEDPSVMWLPEGECRFRITKPDSKLAAERMVQSGLDFEVRKGRLASYTEEELQVKYAEIQTIMLP